MLRRAGHGDQALGSRLHVPGQGVRSSGLLPVLLGQQHPRASRCLSLTPYHSLLFFSMSFSLRLSFFYLFFHFLSFYEKQ